MGEVINIGTGFEISVLGAAQLVARIPPVPALAARSHAIGPATGTKDATPTTRAPSASEA